MPGELRPLWSGTITFGLVSIPVELVAAQRRAPGMKMVASTAEHSPIKREYFCPDDGKALSRDEIVRGYPMEDGQMVPITDEELESLAPRSSRDIDLTQFVDHAAINPVYFRRAYFLVPSGSVKAYRLLAETMEQTGRAGIARFVMRDIEYLVAIFAENGILRAETLRFGGEVRDAGDIPVGKAKADAKLVKRLEKAVDELMQEELDEDELTDETAEKRHKRASGKRARGKDVIVVAEAAPAGAGDPDDRGDGAARGAVIDIMKVLKERMAAGTRRGKRAAE